MKTATVKIGDLTNEETIFWYSLPSVPKNSGYGMACYMMFKENRIDVFREFIQTLAEQNNDCPGIMEKILGNAAYKALMACIEQEPVFTAPNDGWKFADMADKIIEYKRP